MEHKFTIGGIVGLIVLLIVSVYMIAYTFPTAASVTSNSTGLWKGCPAGQTCAGGTGGNGVTGVNQGVWALSAIVVPLILIVCLVMAFVRYATG